MGPRGLSLHRAIRILSFALAQLPQLRYLGRSCRVRRPSQCPACRTQSPRGGSVAWYVAGFVRAPRAAGAEAHPQGQASPHPARRATALGDRQCRGLRDPLTRGVGSGFAMAAGIRVRHARSCTSTEGGRCNCKPTFQAQAYDAQAGRQVWRTFPTISAAKLWRSDAQVALRRGTLRAPTAKNPQRSGGAADQGRSRRLDPRSLRQAVQAEHRPRL